MHSMMYEDCFKTRTNTAHRVTKTKKKNIISPRVLPSGESR